MVAAEMLCKVVLSCKSTMCSMLVSFTARGIAVINLCTVCLMDTSNMAYEVSFALERSAANATLDSFAAGMTLFSSALGRPERYN